MKKITIYLADLVIRMLIFRWSKEIKGQPIGTKIKLTPVMRLYTKHIKSLDGKFSASVTFDLKKQNWAEIADLVSELGPIQDSKQCQKKYLTQNLVPKAKLLQFTKVIIKQVVDTESKKN